MPSRPFNREDHVFHSTAFAETIREALDFLADSPTHALPPPAMFYGTGVYALYYMGNFPHYRPIAEANRMKLTQPIYVGKAVPPGWRLGRTTGVSLRALFGRLREHARSIEQVKTSR